MIFKQVDEILSGRKTQTRRVAANSNRFEPIGEGAEYGLSTLTSAGVWRLRWAEGRTYAVQPGRGKPTVWWTDQHGIPGEILTNESRRLMAEGHLSLNILSDLGWQPARIRITAIRQERLRDITEADARAEGVASVEEYRELWQRINGKTKGARWQDNPLVWVLTFELAKEAQS